MAAKTEKELALDKKMEEIRKKNEAILKRQKEIEEDKKLASKTSKQPSSSKIAAGPPGRGSRGPEHTSPAYSIALPKLHSDQQQETKKHRTADPWSANTSDRNADSPTSPSNPGLNFLSQDPERDREDMERKERPTRGRGGRGGGRGGRGRGDDYRNREPQNGYPQRGGGRGRGRGGRGGGFGPERGPESGLRAKEQEEYLEWRSEREKIDRERLARHQNSSGEWKREWDQNKDQEGAVTTPPKQHQQSKTSPKKSSPPEQRDLREKLAEKRNSRSSGGPAQSSPKEPNRTPQRSVAPNSGGGFNISFENNPNSRGDVEILSEEEVQGKKRNGGAQRPQNLRGSSGRKPVDASRGKRRPRKRGDGGGPVREGPSSPMGRTSAEIEEWLAASPTTGVTWDEENLVETRAIDDEEGWEDVEEGEVSTGEGKGTPEKTPLPEEAESSPKTASTDDDLSPGKRSDRFRTESWDRIERDMINTLDRNIKAVEAALDESDEEEEVSNSKVKSPEPAEIPETENVVPQEVRDCLDYVLQTIEVQ